MVEIEWTPFAEVDPKREYLAFSQIGELKSSLSLFSIIAHENGCN